MVFVAQKKPWPMGYIGSQQRLLHSPLHATVHPVAVASVTSRLVHACVLRLSQLCAELGERDTER
jgi:hypothetical protein